MKTKMKKVTVLMIAAVFFVLNMQPAGALDKGSLLDRVQTAFDKQVSLSEKPRTMEEINAILDSHFTDQFKEKFVLENVIETEEGFQTFGSDFAPFYIPNFSYSDETKAVKKGDSVFLIEYFRYEEGPVYFEDGYQGVKLTNVDGVLKIEDILYTMPEELKNELNVEDTSSVSDMKSETDEKKTAPLSAQYMNKQYHIFSGYFLDNEQVDLNLI
ncbi:DUF3993 domain-containing protein [Bacillus salacetis]|uniref:DUF3993 domain-containing protein n=1 Tax=Bacillus salacetis TaxID=2315464 RepID=A0A3A1QSG2_9BACI|nr:DUF3993 domain-containing protein [Bacillus salacetis]RIW29510.1 DUF3993 domain-containing protein [Bacillus salacetis]